MQAFRASILDFKSSPFYAGDASWRYFDDGLLLVDQGRIVDCGDWSTLSHQIDVGSEVVDYSGHLLMPGFIDSHVHYPQTDVIASHGTQLLDWLERYTFPAEKQFSDREHADDVARFFIDQLLANGTTSALVFATIHPESVDAIFSAAADRDMRLVSGKVMMDRHAPDELKDTAQSSYDDSVALIDRWHGQHRLHYAVTPRFAVTSSEQQLKVAQQLFNDYEGVYLQSHVAENTGEVEWVSKLFPSSRSYLDVYDRFELLGERAVYAHCIHLDAQDQQRMADSKSTVSFCPTSNLFLGSGLFDMRAAVEKHMPLSIGSDVGGGTSFSLLKTLHEAYKVCQMGGFSLSSLQMFYLLTLGAAKSLSLDRWIGNFETGKEADFVVIDWNATELMRRRMSFAESLQERLFALIILGDDRNITATHVMGKPVYRRGQ